jgi:arginine-tRNA-protein transferase
VQRPTLIACEPPELLVDDRPFACPYLPSRTARLPMRLPGRPLEREELSVRLASGDRRQGVFLYRTACPSCRACEPVRIEVSAFAPSKTQRRTYRRGESLIETRVGTPSVTPDRIALYNRHKVERGLLVRGDLIDAIGYEDFLVETCVETIEVSYRIGRKLIGVAIADRAADALSAVYCYFDPAYEKLSPGTYSILKMADLCRQLGLRYLYLGLYVAGSRTMAYKARFLPNERLIGGKWQRFER